MVDIDLIRALTESIKNIPITSNNQEHIDALQGKIDSLKQVDN